MRVEVFDDWLSVGHAALGAISVFMPIIQVIFWGYEVIEFAYKRGRKKEKVGEFVGDLMEFLVGAGIAGLILGML